MAARLTPEMSMPPPLLARATCCEEHNPREVEPPRELEREASTEQLWRATHQLAA